MRWRIPILAVVLFPVFSFAQAGAKAKATVDYVLALRQADGGYIAARADPKLPKQPTSSLRATTAALRAIKYFGGEAPDQKATAGFVAGCFDEIGGGFADAPHGKPDVLTTAIGLMAVAELKMPEGPYAAKAAKFLIEHVESFDDARIAIAGFEALKKLPPDTVREKWLLTAKSMDNGDGAYGKGEGLVRDTGSVIAMKLRLGFAVDAKAKSRQLLAAGQRSDGGFGKAGAIGSDLETTYRVMRAIHMLGEKPKEMAKLEAFIAKCRNDDGGYGLQPGKPSNVGATYYAGIVTHWLR